MAVNLGEVKVQETVAAAFVRSRENLAKSPDNLTHRFAGKLKDANAENAFKVMGEVRSSLRAGEQRVGMDQVQDKVLRIDPDGTHGTKRADVEKNILQVKSLAEKGFLDPGTDQASVNTAVALRIKERPELQREYRALKDDPEAQKQFRGKIAKDPRFRLCVQDRLGDLVDRDQFTGMAERVAAGQTSFDTENDKLAELTSEKAQLEKQKTEIETRKTKFQTDHGTELSTHQTNIDTQEGAEPGKKVRFASKYEALQKQKAEAARLEQQLNSNLSAEARRRIEPAYTKLTGSITTAETELLTDYPDHLQQQKLLEEQRKLEEPGQGIDQMIADKQVEIDKQKPIVDQKQKELDDLKIRYTAIEDEFVRDVGDIYGWAAEQYMDDRMGEFITEFENRKPEFTSEMVAEKWKALSDAQQARWFKDRGIWSGGLWRQDKRIDKGAVRKDLQAFLNDGPENYLHSVTTDPAIIKELTPHLIEDMFRMGDKMNLLTDSRLEQFLTADWAKDYRDKFASNPAFAKSLSEYRNGNKDNKEWLYILLGLTVAVSQTIQNETREENP